MADGEDEISIGVTFFKHNRPFAAIAPLKGEHADVWGVMRGTVKVAPGTDLMKGTGEVWETDAQR
jgi:hypothetical protein